MDRLPLASVRTFEVVARLLSVSRAAEELEVTPSAVSHQIRTLEEYLGTALFTRANNTLRLTAAGQQYMSQVSESLLLLARATNHIRSGNDGQVLRVGITPSIAVLWLLPRLAAFEQRHPEVTLSITAVPDTPPLMNGAFDIAFWYGSGLISGLLVEPLGTNRAFPICSPRLIKSGALRHVGDLRDHALLDSVDIIYHAHREPFQPGWSDWLQAARAGIVSGRKHQTLTPRVLVHQAVVAGVGIGLSRTLLADDGLRAREIAVPFGPALPLQMTYNLACPTHLSRRADVAAFREWVAEEAEKSVRRVERLLEPHLASG